jgi:hypothetical protein
VIKLRYRQDYTGEFVILGTNFRDGIKIQQREWVENSIVNQHISGRAAVILSDVDRDKFDYSRLQHHRGGLRGTKRLQTYATGIVWQHLPLNFFVSTDDITLTMIDHSSYGENTVVYTDRKRVLEFSGKFFLVPYCPIISDPALAIYLAAFDGHSEIFILGYNIFDGVYHKDWPKHIAEVIDCYSNCKFYFIGRSLPVCLATLQRFPNVELMDLRKFISFCDI